MRRWRLRTRLQYRIRKVYWGAGYTGNQITEYPNMANFQANTNAITINLAMARQGTYHAALKGFIYYNNTSIMYRASAATGATVASAPLANAGNTNQTELTIGQRPCSHGSRGALGEPSTSGP